LSVILVVDDDKDVRLLLREILEAAGHEVVEAEHGAAALDLITLQRLPDLVVTDLAMPILGGEELIGSLRSRSTTAAIPIVVVSGNAAAAWTLKASGLVEAVVAKPFAAGAVTACIRDVASRGSRRPLVA
jgi:two-component system, OmpR family, KDP operon response regulator KdpE